jgi:hypothetical protein
MPTELPVSDKLLLRRYLNILPNLAMLSGLWLHVVLLDGCKPRKDRKCYLDDKYLFTLERSNVSANIFELFKDVYDSRVSGQHTGTLEFGCTSILRVYTDRIDFFIRGLDFYINRENTTLECYNDYLVRLVATPWKRTPWGYGLSYYCDGIVPCYKNGISRRRNNRIISEKIDHPQQQPIILNQLEKCGICNINTRVLNYPCGHIYSCLLCTDLAGPNCAICRVLIESTIDVFVV